MNVTPLGRWSALLLVAGIFSISMSPVLRGDDARGEEGEDGEILPGHSIHGQVFNEGPRQKAYLMGGTGNIHFPVTTKSPEAQKFFEQGVGQLHGFWFYEAERSFRTAAALDPDCAMNYWGMAMANLLNYKRFDGFAAEAEKRTEGLSEREVLYIKGLRDPANFRRITRRNPDDLEAKAFNAMMVGGYHSGGTGYPDRDIEVVNLCKEILDVNSMHPCHHYVIHAWDALKEPFRAYESARRAGPSAPSIAHMWHMAGGHVYSRMWHYDEAVYLQEAAARVDHAQMMRDLLLPDQIHLYAHNNEWLVRNLGIIGRVHDAINLAKNMLELPRHPKYNLLRERDEPSFDEGTQSQEVQLDSSYYGRKRLFETLARYELWDEMLRLAKTPYLEPTDVFTEQTEHYRFLGTAYFRKGDLESGKMSLELLRNRLNEQLEQRRQKLDSVVKEAQKTSVAVHEARDEVVKRYDFRIRQLEDVIQQLSVYATIESGWYLSTKVMHIVWIVLGFVAAALLWVLRRRKVLLAAALLLAASLAGGVYWGNRPLQASQVAKAKIDPMYFAHVKQNSGDGDDAEEIVKAYISRHQREVWPLAHLIDIQWKNGNREGAAATFKELQQLSSAIDLDIPVFARLAPIAKELGYSEDWRAPKKEYKDDIWPVLDTLGPFRWTPPPAKPWTLSDADGKQQSLKDYKGRPLCVIFYLGASCLHCAKQLQAFAPKLDEFDKAGFHMVAISTDDVEGLKQSVKNYGAERFPFPLLSNKSLDVFKAYRCFDDFEDHPLHGTFLIDGDGKIIWHDIGFEPFLDPDFVITEGKRLLDQQGAPIHSHGGETVTAR